MDKGVSMSTNKAKIPDTRPGSTAYIHSRSSVNLRMLSSVLSIVYLVGFKIDLDQLQTASYKIE